MAFFDEQSGEIVVRILYDGLATAGKTSTIVALSNLFTHHARGQVYAPELTASGRTAYFDWLELSAGSLDDRPLRCQVLSVPGQLALAERRFALLRDLDAVVLVCESTVSGVRRARIAYAFLTEALRAWGSPDVPLLLQANKQDLPQALAPDEVARAVLNEDIDPLPFRPSGHEASQSRARHVPVIGTSATTGDNIRLGFISALNLARDKVRADLGRGSALQPWLGSAEDAYRAMLEVGNDDDPGEAFALALDASLNVLEREGG